MTVHAKLMKARVKLQGTELKRSGENKFAGYKYFELKDFLPTVQQIFHDLGLCGVMSFAPDIATLTITDLEDGTTLNITSPMSTAALKGCHEVQNLGAVQTYIRRYLWVTALEIVEHDALDATMDPEESEPKKPAQKPAAKAPTVPTHIEGKDEPGQIKITIKRENDLPAWIAQVLEASRIQMAASSSVRSLNTVWTVNRNIFDTLKEQAPEDYEALMAEFAERKKQIKAKEAT